MRHEFVLSLIVLFALSSFSADKSPQSIRVKASPDRIKAALNSYLFAQGWTIVSDTQFQSVYTKDLSGGEEFAARLLMGNANSNKPLEHLTFTFSPEGDEAITAMREEIIVENGMGYVNRTALTDKKHRDADANFLRTLKSSVEGQASHHSVYFGVYFVSKESVLLKAVDSGSPAEKAGLRGGDMLVSYNGVATTTLQALETEAAKSKPGDIVRISFLRDAKLVETDVTMGAPPK